MIPIRGFCSSSRCGRRGGCIGGGGRGHGQFLQAETLIIELLLVVSLVALAVQRLRVPYTVALVVAGLVNGNMGPEA
jgi:hypothetical protein